MRKKLNELGISNISLDLLETELIKRAEPAKKIFYVSNKRLQTKKFKSENYYKPVDPLLES